MVPRGGNLVRPPVKILLNTIAATDAGLYYNDPAKGGDGKTHLVLKEYGIDIPGGVPTTPATTIVSAASTGKTEPQTHLYCVRDLPQAGVAQEDVWMASAYHPTGSSGSLTTPLGLFLRVRNKPKFDSDPSNVYVITGAYGKNFKVLAAPSTVTGHVGEIGETDKNILVDKIVDDINTDTESPVGAYKVCKISMDDTSDASTVTITTGGTAYAVTSSGPHTAAQMVIDINGTATLGAAVVAVQVGTTDEIYLQSETEGVDFTVTIGTDTSIVDYGVRLKADSVNVKFEVWSDEEDGDNDFTEDTTAATLRKVVGVFPTLTGMDLRQIFNQKTTFPSKFETIPTATATYRKYVIRWATPGIGLTQSNEAQTVNGEVHIYALDSVADTGNIWDATAGAPSILVNNALYMMDVPTTPDATFEEMLEDWCGEDPADWYAH